MRFATPMLALAATPARAAGESFFSLSNTDFVVLLAFLLFIGVLVYFRVPRIVAGMLDKRAAGIQSDLEEARRLKEEAQELLASFERKKREVQQQADRIVAQARKEAEASAEQARKDIEAQIARRMAAAEEQIAQAEAKAVKEVRDRAIAVAVAAARQVVAEQMTPEARSESIDRGIATVGERLH